VAAAARARARELRELRTHGATSLTAANAANAANRLRARCDSVHASLMENRSIWICGVIALLAACGGGGGSVPAEWKDIAPKGGSVVEAASDKENLTSFYSGSDVGKLRQELRAKLEAKGLKLGYQCDFPDQRVSDGFIAAPNAVEYSLIPQKDGRVMLSASRSGDTAGFAAAPDPAACKLVQ
jgi:hypothetical protein